MKILFADKAGNFKSRKAWVWQVIKRIKIKYRVYIYMYVYRYN